MTRLRLGDRTVLLDEHAVESAAGRETLTPLEVKFLRFLRDADGPVSRDSLLTGVWNYKASVRTRAVHHAVTRLRRKLEDNPSKPKYLKTVRGVGYVLSLPEAPPATPVATAPTRLFGRESELADLHETVETPGLVSILGPGGVGKTHLVTHLLHGLDRPSLLCSLALCESHESMVAEVCRALGITATTSHEAIARAMSGQRIRLLVLDNLEQAIDAARTLVSGLLQAAPDLCILTTSRVSLQLSAERTVLLECLPLPTAVTLASAGTSPAVDLFVDRVRRVQPAFQLTEDNVTDVNAVVSAVDGHPLALELAAPRTRVLSLADLAERLVTNIDILRDRHADGEPRHQTLSGVLQSSVDALPPAVQQLFAQMSCFSGSFALNAAEAVAGTDALDALQTLVEHSLVVSDEGRMRLLVPVRAFARDLLQSNPKLHERTIAGHRRFYAQLGTTDALRAAECSVDHAEHLVTERQNLITACLMSVKAADAPCAVHALCAAVEGLRATAQHAECLDLANAVAQMDDLSASQRLHVEIHAAIGLQQIGQRADALARLAASHPCSDVELNATRLRLLGELHHDNGNAEASAEAFRTALDRVQQPQFEWTRAEILGSSARVLADSGHSDQARPAYQAAVELLQAQGRTTRLAPVATNYANLHRALGNVAEASRWYERAIRSAAASGAQRVEAVARCNRATMQIDFAQYEAARQGLERGLDQLQRIGDVHYEGIFLGIASEMYTELGQLDRAEDALRRARACHDSLDDALWTSVVDGRLAVLRRAQGRFDEAIAGFDSVLPLLQDRFAHGYALFYSELAQTRAAAGDLEGAVRDFDIANGLLSHGGWPVEQTLCLAAQARYLATHDPDRAREALMQAKALQEQLRRPPESRMGRAVAAAERALCP